RRGRRRSQSHPGWRDRHRGRHRDVDPRKPGLPAELIRRRSHGPTIAQADGLGGSGRVVHGRAGLRPVGVQHPGPGVGHRVADQGPGRDHPGGNQTGAVGDLGGLPGRQLAGSHLAFDYPENTADSLMCESLLLQAPGGALKPGLATVSSPSPTTMVFTLRPGVKFWDGQPVTPADVVYSLDRNTDPKLGGFYSAVFSRVSSIAATGSNQVTITLKQPDYWLEGELASMPGIIIEKSFAQQQG